MTRDPSRVQPAKAPAAAASASTAAATSEPAAPQPTPDVRKLPGLREARLQLVIALLTTGLLGLAMVLAQAPQQRFTGECTPETEDIQCAEDQVCIANRCHNLANDAPLRCQEGDPCSRCVCGDGYTCDSNDVCRVVKEDQCDPELAQLVAEILAFERDRCNAVGSDATQCEPAELDRFIIQHQQLTTLLLKLNNTFTVHFDQNQPSAERDLPRTIEDYYQRRFSDHGDRLRGAHRILILARASRDRDKTSRSRSIANNNLAQNRMQKVAQWIVNLDESPRGRDDMSAKLIRLSIGEREPLTPEQLAAHPQHQFLAWKKSREDYFVREVFGTRVDQPETLGRALNQSVLVVPLPCVVD